jgi:hypothetical protein
MKSSNGTSSLGLSQIIQWDRWVVNPIEMKCPKIRNTLAWTVELERKGGNDNGGTGGISNHSYDYYHQPLQSEHSEQQQQHHESAPSRRSLVVATPRAGIVWQLNRSLAVKVVLSEQSQVSAQLSSNYGNNLRWYVVFYWGRLPPTEELLRLVLAVRPSSPFNCKAWEYNWKIGGDSSSTTTATGEDNSDFLYRESSPYSNSVLPPQSPPTKPTLVE